MVKQIAYNTRTTTRRLTSCLLFFIAASYSACQGSAARELQQGQHVNSLRATNAAAAIAIAAPLLQTGDIITRTGTDITSETLRRLCKKDATYSHCGIVSRETSGIFVYHALGGDSLTGDALRKDPLAVFCDARTNSGFGIFRLPTTTGQQSLVQSIAQQYYRAKLPFDRHFNLQTDTAMYCSEFVFKVFTRALAGKTTFPLSQTGAFTYVGVDDIFLQPAVREIRRFQY